MSRIEWFEDHSPWFLTFLPAHSDAHFPVRIAAHCQQLGSNASPALQPVFISAILVRISSAHRGTAIISSSESSALADRRPKRTTGLAVWDSVTVPVLFNFTDAD